MTAALCYFAEEISSVVCIVVWF